MDSSSSSSSSKSIISSGPSLLQSLRRRFPAILRSLSLSALSRQRALKRSRRSFFPVVSSLLPNRSGRGIGAGLLAVRRVDERFRSFVGEVWNALLYCERRPPCALGVGDKTGDESAGTVRGEDLDGVCAKAENVLCEDGVDGDDMSAAMVVD